MSGTQGVVVLVGKLDGRASELGKIFFYDIFQVVAGEHCLLLKDADIAPSVDDLGLDIPQCRVTYEICSVMQESCRSNNLSVPAAFHIHHLGRLGTHQPDKAVALLLALLLGRKGQTDKQSQQYIDKFLHQDYSVLRNFAYHPSRSKTQSSNIGSITI